MQSEANRNNAIRRRVGTPFTLAEWRAMRIFASVGMVESYLLQLPLKDSCIVHVRLPIGRQRRAILVLNMFNAGFTLADPTPRLCPDAGCLANVNGFPTHIGCRSIIGRPSGGRRPIRSRTCTMQLSFRGSYNKEGSFTVKLTQMYALRPIRPMWMGFWRDVGWLFPDLPPTTSEANRGIEPAYVKPALYWPTTSRLSLDDAWQPMPGREPIHIGRADSIGAQSGRWIG